MRILYLVSFPDDGRNLGGIETYGQELQLGVAARGHDVATVHLYAPDIMKTLTVADRIPRYRWLNRYYWWRGTHLQDYRYHNAVRRLSRKRLEAFAPDVIHCLHCYLGGALTGITIPYIVSCYGLEVIDAPPIRGLLEGASIVHSISEFTKARAIQAASTARHQVLTWGINTTEQAGALPATYDLITVGRVVKRKNIETVVHALQHAPDLRYCVAGDGPELPHLKALVAQYRMKNVDFLGAVSETQKRKLLAQSRLFIMCPTNADDDVEGLGVVYFEAHGAGLPVIASTSGGVPEAVGDAGLIVSDPLDSAEILRTIRAALEPSAHARLLSAVKVRQGTHSWTRFIDAFEQVYADTLA